ncbi:MAG: hypothetical protein NT120_03630 [Candidatus Aenigmarchaeota archaeon]|nr:hypothetical protein [Candidatus Aenigmarchaeota archaeon]
MKKYVIPIIILFVLSAVVVADETSPNVRVSLLKYSPFPAGPGNYMTLTLKVENNGNADANGVRLKLPSVYPFLLSSNSTVSIENSATSLPIDSDGIVTIGTIPAFQYTLVDYTVFVANDVPEGVKQLQVWSQPKPQDSWSIGAFSILVQGIDKLSINAVPSILTPGKPTAVNFTLSNSGTAFIRNVVFTWSESNNKILPLGSGNIEYVQDISPGESAIIPFTLVADPSATSGVYTLTVDITYTIGTNITKSLNTNMGMFVGGAGDFDVSVQDSTSGTTSLSIANVGANPATSVSVSIPDQDGYVVTGSSSSFLGNLNPGDFTLTSFQITSRTARNFTAGSNPIAGNNPAVGANPTAGTRANTNMLKVDITYTDTNSNRQVVEKYVSLQAQASTLAARQFTQRSGNSYDLVIIGIAGVVIIVLLIKFRTKVKSLLKRKKKSQT